LSINKLYLKIGKIGFIAAVTILILIPILPILPSYYSVHTYIDIHSGKVKKQLRICGIKTKEEIKETEFSKLVRKFPDIQKEPDWKYCFGKYHYIGGAGYDDNFKWPDFLSRCALFAEIVDPNSMSESEMKDSLEECLGYMEKGDSEGFDKRLDAYYKSHEDK
jgi:hypothetical protein